MCLLCIDHELNPDHSKFISELPRTDGQASQNTHFLISDFVILQEVHTDLVWEDNCMFWLTLYLKSYQWR